MNALRARPVAVVTMLVASLAALATGLAPWFTATTDQAAAASSQTGALVAVVVILPALMLTVLAQLTAGGIDVKTLAFLGLLSAVIAALRPLGSGVGGVETVFFMLILGGRAFGAGFGFALGGISLLASALLTGGVGPWLGMQMACSAWIAGGAGLLPKRVRGKAEIALLAAYGVVASYLFGAIMNLWFWPLLAGSGTVASGIGFVPGASPWLNLKHFLAFTLVTSTASWDTVRAVTCALCLVGLGAPVLKLLRRAGARAAFAPAPVHPTQGQPAAVSSSPSAPAVAVPSVAAGGVGVGVAVTEVRGTASRSSSAGRQPSMGVMADSGS
jgi:energy-coupling factor transport system substrate-specific component